MIGKKKDTYIELVLTYDQPLSVLEDFIARAKASGLNTFEANVDICPYYGGVDGVTLRADFSETTSSQ